MRANLFLTHGSCWFIFQAYRIIVRPTKAEEPSGIQLAVTHVLGQFCNASAKYAQGQLMMMRGWTDGRRD